MILALLFLLFVSFFGLKTGDLISCGGIVREMD